MNTRKARMIVDFGLHKVLAHDAQGRARHVLVPGTEGKQYNVYLTRRGNQVEAACELTIHGNNTLPCRGNRISICTHVLSALYAAAREADRDLAFCLTSEKANRLVNLHNGSISVAVSKNSRKPVYLVTWK